jgi:hypothetical protein
MEAMGSNPVRPWIFACKVRVVIMTDDMPCEGLMIYHPWSPSTTYLGRSILDQKKPVGPMQKKKMNRKEMEKQKRRQRIRKGKGSSKRREEKHDGEMEEKQKEYSKKKLRKGEQILTSKYFEMLGENMYHDHLTITITSEAQENSS